MSIVAPEKTDQDVLALNVEYVESGLAWRAKCIAERDVITVRLAVLNKEIARLDSFWDHGYKEHPGIGQALSDIAVKRGLDPTVCDVSVVVEFLRTNLA